MTENIFEGVALVTGAGRGIGRASALALAEAGAEVIGVNTRDLRSFDVDLEASEGLMEQIPADVTAVAESGLTSAGE